jgi:hypothetical protein
VKLPERQWLLCTIDNIVGTAAQISFFLARIISGMLPVFACLVSQTEHWCMKLSRFTVFERHTATPFILG